MPGTIRVAKPCGCAQEAFMGKKREKTCPCGNLFERPERLDRNGTNGTNGTRKARKGLKRGRGFAVHPKQRDKIKGLPCVNCGIDEYEVPIDPAHVWSRSYTPCDCPDGVVPLCRPCHGLFDNPNLHLDLLPKLIDRGYRAEIVHAFVVHEIPFGDIYKRLTGQEWRPVEREGVAG
jgi:hypothetical protein